MKKAQSLFDEFSVSTQEHPIFFGAERKAGQKRIERALGNLACEVATCEDADREKLLKTTKKQMDILQSTIRAYQKGTNFVQNFKEVESYAGIEPVVCLTFLPRWLLKEKFMAEAATAESAEFWPLLSLANLQDIGYTEGERPKMVSTVVADRVVEAGRRETVVSFPGAKAFEQCTGPLS